jgi:uncharacterized repeat protein (TIGR04076 family)
MPKCKITVLKKMVNQDLADEYLRSTESFSACELYEEGQEFILDGMPEKPEGFCDWAWVDIHKDVATVMFDGSFPWMRQPGTAVACCTDGLRPVVFKVERIE